MCKKVKFFSKQEALMIKIIKIENELQEMKKFFAEKRRLEQSNGQNKSL